MTEFNKNVSDAPFGASVSQNSAISKDTRFINETLSKIGKDVIKYSPSKILGTVVNLFLVPIYTNLLLPDQYGLYSAVITLLSFLCILFSDWVGLSGLRFFKEHQVSNNIKPYFSTLLFLLVSNLAVMYLLGFSLFNFIGRFFNIPSDLLYIVLWLIIPVAIRALLFQVLRAQIKPLAYSISVIINQLTTVLFAVYFIKTWNLEAKAILFGMAASIALIDIIMMMQSRITKELQLEQVKFNILSSFYKYGAPIAASSLGMWFISQSNRLVLMHYKGNYFNGLCGVSFNLTFSIILPLFATITLAAIPRIFNSYESGHDVNPIITKLTGYYFLIFSPIIFALCIFPKEMVTLFSNKHYADAYILMPFLALSIFAFGLSEYTTIQYHLAKKTYIDTIIKIIPGLLGMFASIIFIPKYGILGVGIATFASNSLYLILSLFIRLKGLEWTPPVSDINKTIVGIVVCAFALMLYRHFIHLGLMYDFVIQLFIMTSVYLTALKLQSKLIH